MNKTKVLMHKNSMDVAIMVISSQNMEENVNIDGYWINLGYTGNPWVLDGNVKLTIPQDKFSSEWVDISDKYLNPRTKPGIPV
jgi:hypothetical protein